MFDGVCSTGKRLQVVRMMSDLKGWKEEKETKLDFHPLDLHSTSLKITFYDCFHSVCGGVWRGLKEDGENILAPDNLHPAPGSHLTLVRLAFARGVPLSPVDVTLFRTSSGRP